MNIETSFCLPNKCAEHYWLSPDTSLAIRGNAEINGQIRPVLAKRWHSVIRTGPGKDFRIAGADGVG